MITQRRYVVATMGHGEIRVHANPPPSGAKADSTAVIELIPSSGLTLTLDQLSDLIQALGKVHGDMERGA